MTDTLNTVKPKGRWPVFGILSIAFPLLGIPAALVVGLLVSFPLDARPAADPDAYPNWGGYPVFIYGSVLTLLSGLISAAVALSRVERLRVLPFLAIAGIVATVLWFLLPF